MFKTFPIYIVAVLAIWGLGCSHQAPLGNNQGLVSADARSYVKNLNLRDVTMKATENFMHQQVIEVEGTIANRGSRALKSVDVYCIFSAVDGHELHRERVAIVLSRSKPLQPNENRPFRLPFDTVPEGWNQAIPRMFIAGINFAG